MDNRLLDEDHVLQICFVTHDAVKSAQWFSDLTGKPMPEMTFSADPDKAQATYMGEPANITCKIMMFHFGNIDLEFLEPGPQKSAWRDLLEERGPGCHHLAFKTRNLTKRHEFLESKGHKLLQRGEFQSQTGRYAYYDTKEAFGALLELLEFDRDKEPQNA
jgi:methylmalonyl-CoA/ethylmalonyl-CoA epimerase